MVALLMASRPIGSVSWQRMERGIQRVRERLLRAAAALEAAGIPYAVAGGNAVAAWVSRVDEVAVRNTRDVDILLRRVDFKNILSALEAAGFVYRQVSSLGRAGVMDVFLDGPDAKVRDALHVLWAGEPITSESIQISPEIGESEPTEEFRLLNLDALVRMKLTAFRDKDRVHLRDLIDVGLLDPAWFEKLPSPLATRLKELFDNPE
ncbi:MAG: hypothetical protein ACR2OZ_13645 [Verrucomicrobiales bacterium]